MTWLSLIWDSPVTNYYLIALIIGAVVLGLYFIRRHNTLVRTAPRGHLEPSERLADALEDMRLKGTATPEELSAETEAARELGVPPAEIPGFPRTPEDMEQQGEAARQRQRERGGRRQDAGPAAGPRRRD